MNMNLNIASASLNLPWDLNTVWFFIIGVLLTGYAVLDGFDLGVGILHLFTRTDENRRVLLNAIGPVWDGNEVWLVTAGGALFAAFPNAYATAFSGYYLAFIILLAALIFRAVAIEFRSKEAWPWWRNMWDIAFCAGSLLASFLFGLALGNVVNGLPIQSNTEFTGSSILQFIRPYPVVVGLFVVSLFTLHGAIYLHTKTEGTFQETIRFWIMRAFGLFLVMYMLTTIMTLVTQPHMIHNFETYPWVWSVVVLTVLAIANIPRSLHIGQEFRVLLTSAAVITGTLFLFGIGLFPNLLPSALNPAWSLNIYNAASSPKTLGIMLIIALLGMPFVLGYTASIYWIFRGKVKMDKFSY